MKRRTLLHWIASASAALRLPWAQTATFPGTQADTLRALAGTVLPAEIDAASIAEKFAQWVRDYRPGAEMEHGYGNTRLRKKGPSPAATYLKQLDALRSGVLGNDSRTAVIAAIGEAKINDIPRNPDGQNVIADLMAFYFRSSDANDLCYRAAIGRDRCRGLAGSEKPPAELA